MKLLVIVCLSLLFPALGFSATYEVPGDYGTIQDALAAAQSGDTILVDAGTYLENIDFLGKGVILQSSMGAAATVIDGSQAGPVVSFVTGEGPDAVLDGFTVTNGLAQTGGGILVSGAGPEIRNNIITLNTAANGGGVTCLIGSSPIIVFNEIIENTTINGSFSAGAGVQCTSSTMYFANNLVMKNIPVASFVWNGGGINCVQSTATLINNVIKENGSLTSPGSGGGVSCQDSEVDLVNNLILKNSANYGAGVHYSSGNSGPELLLMNCVLFENTAAVSGGGLMTLGGLTTGVTVVNSILWNNQAPQGKEARVGQFLGASNMNIQYSTVEGGKSSCYLEPNSTMQWGPAMIEQDPQWIDPAVEDFRLTVNSPCINRGTNVGAPALDFAGLPRPFMGTVDMGAHEFSETHTLKANLFSLTASLGGQVRFSLRAGAAQGGRIYLMLGSGSGNAPGLPIPGTQVVMPINWDHLTTVIRASLNTPMFVGFAGPLNGAGEGRASFNLDPRPLTSGLTLSFAYILVYPTDFASNPVNIKIVP